MFFFALFNTQGWVQGGKKSSPCKNKTKLNLTKHNFFVTKATDLKTIFLKNP